MPDQSAMIRNQRNACLSVGILALVTAAPAVAGPLTSVSMNGSITFSEVLEMNNPDPVGLAGVRTTDGWKPWGLQLSDGHPRVAQIAQFRSGDGPGTEQAPQTGDSWGFSMFAGLEVLEAGQVSGEAGHRLDVGFQDMTRGASTYVFRGIVDMAITGHVQASSTQKAVTTLHANAYVKTDDSFVHLINFGDVVLSDEGVRSVNRSLWSTFEFVMQGAPGSATSIDMWMDLSFSTTLSAVPAPSGALCLLGLGGLIACGRRR